VCETEIRVRDMNVDASSIHLERVSCTHRWRARLWGRLFNLRPIVNRLGRLRTAASRRVANPPQDAILPRIAASRKRRVLDVSGIWPIDNRPQATSLPHKIVAAREETKM
jgi:hypothetical protein